MTTDVVQEPELGFKAQLKKTVWNAIKGWGYEFETKNVRHTLGIASSQRQYSVFISLVLDDLVRDKKLKANRDKLPVKYQVLRV